MIYANPVPVASACQLEVAVVKETLNIIFKAIEDLINIHDRDIQLQMGFCAIRFTNKNLQVVFADYLSKEVSGAEFEGSMRRMTSPVATLWKTN